MKIKASLLIATLLLSTSVILITGSARAQNDDDITLSVSPPVFELSANPGEVNENSVRVTNLSDKPQTIQVDKRNFTALGEEGGVDLTEDETSFSLAEWIEVDKGETVIPAQSSEVFEFTIAVPNNAEPGGHFGSLIFKTKVKPLDEDEAGASVGQEVGSLLLVKVAGDIEEDARIAGFSPEKGFYESGPVEFATRIKNNGNVHFKPRGNITINNMFGSEVAKLQLDERNVLPGSIRKVGTVWDDPGFRIGRYTANLSVVYGSEGDILNSSATFVMLPYKPILAGLIVLAIVAFVGYRYRARFQEAYKALSGKR